MLKKKKNATCSFKTGRKVELNAVRISIIEATFLTVVVAQATEMCQFLFQPKSKRYISLGC